MRHLGDITKINGAEIIGDVKSNRFENSIDKEKAE